MKTILMASTLGLVSSVAMAECSGHRPVSTAADIDQTIVTASVATSDGQGDGKTLLPRRVPEDARTADGQRQ